MRVYLNVPTEYRRSLGEGLVYKHMLWTKRHVSVDYGTKVPGKTVEPTGGYVGKLFDQIRFQYVPAIKDDRVFERLLGEVYATLAEQTGFQTALAEFAASVQDATRSLSAALEKQTQLKSTIAPPTDFEALFRSLDFQTGENNDRSLLKQRGDGVKVRHIPHLLKFIAAKSKQNRHIFAFEEPENSLSYASAVAEAASLLQMARGPKAQVFVTSHSPAFYNLEGKGVQRYVVKQADRTDGVEGRASQARALPADAAAEESMLDAPLLYELAGTLKRVAQERVTAEKARHQLEKLGGPKAILFVEGPSDKQILEAAIERLAPELADRVRVESADGADNLRGIAAVAGPARAAALRGRTLILLLDNDQAGQSVYRKAITEDSPDAATAGTTYARLLPLSDDYRRFLKSMGIPEQAAAFTIEHMFDAATIERARKTTMKKGQPVYVDSTKHAQRLKAVKTSSSEAEARELLAQASEREPNWRRFVYKPEDGCKVPFGDWIARQKNSELFSPFKPLIDELAELVPVTSPDAKRGATP